MHDGIRILSRVIEEKIDAADNFGWLNSFNLGLQLLDDYDHESLDTKGNHNQIAKHPDINEYFDLLNQMRSDFNSDIFGKQKDNGFESAVNQIKQSFGDSDAYPSIEEKAAMLLYLVVKNHAFVDGNKRIADGIERQARESAERNGHLADISVENKKQILRAISGLTIDKQTVHHQTVEHEKVINKE